MNTLKFVTNHLRYQDNKAQYTATECSNISIWNFILIPSQLISQFKQQYNQSYKNTNSFLTLKIFLIQCNKASATDRGGGREPK